MNDHDWQNNFQQIWKRALAAWKTGRKTPERMFTDPERAFLSSIGCTAQELFDFVEDNQDFGEPEFDSVLAVSSLRRDYFLTVQKGRSNGRTVPMHSLPSKDAEADGLTWLPRIMAKARLKLRGEMPPDLMYGCGGDRAFLAQANMTLSEFLQLVRDHDTDDRAIIDALKYTARQRTSARKP